MFITLTMSLLLLIIINHYRWSLKLGWTSLLRCLFRVQKEFLSECIDNANFFFFFKVKYFKILHTSVSSPWVHPGNRSELLFKIVGDKSQQSGRYHRNGILRSVKYSHEAMVSQCHLSLTAQKQDLSSNVFIIPAIYLSQNKSKGKDSCTQLCEPWHTSRTKHLQHIWKPEDVPPRWPERRSVRGQLAVGAPRCMHHRLNPCWRPSRLI